MARVVLLFLVLLGFWAALSWQFENAYLDVVGVVCCLAVALFSQRLFARSPSGVTTGIVLRAVPYAAWLLGQIVLSNLDVAYRVWHPKRPIAPRFVKVPTSLKTDIGLVSYANSITLTPGTVTVDVYPGRLLVHALTAKGERALLAGAMHDRVRWLEGTRDDTSAGNQGGSERNTEGGSGTDAAGSFGSGAGASQSSGPAGDGGGASTDAAPDKPAGSPPLDSPPSADA